MTDAQKWLIFGGVVFTGWLLYLLAPVLTPFVMAALLAYLGDPIVDRLERVRIKRIHFSRTFAVIIVFATMIIFALILLFILIPLIQKQFAAFARVLPQFITWLQENLLPRLGDAFGFDPAIINLELAKQTLAGNWQDVGSVAKHLFIKITQSGQMVFAWLAYLLLIPVVTFYLLRDWDHLLVKLQGLIPRSQLPLLRKLSRECDEVLSEFLRGQLLVMMALGVIYTIGLWIVGIEFALLIGMLAGVVSFVPYLGLFVGIIVAGIAALVQFGDVVHIVYVVPVFVVGQMIEGMVLSPWLVGDRIGLHPVAVIFAVMAGGQLFGFFGVLLALPVAAVIVVLLRYVHDRYIESSLYTP